MTKSLLNIVLLISLGTTVMAQPTLDWVTQYSGVSNVIIYDHQEDNAGNIFTTGRFEGQVDFDPGVGVSTLTSYGDKDIFVAKHNSNGDFLWVKQIGGSGPDNAYSLSIDNTNNICLTGDFNGTANFNPSGTFNMTASGSTDVYILKLSDQGNFIWAKQFEGGANSETGFSIVNDNNDDVVLTGYFMGTVDFDPGPAITAFTASNTESFIVKLNSAGDLIWAKNYGNGTGSVYSRSVDIDKAGNIITTGYFSLNVDFDPGAGTSTLSSAGGWDIFVAKLNTSGNQVWSKQMGGVGNDYSRAIVADSSEAIITTGWFDGGDFDPNGGVVILPADGIEDVFISKLDANGDYLWAKEFANSGYNHGYDICVDKFNNVYSIGVFNGSIDFDPNGGNYVLNSNGSDDIYILKLDSLGNFEWAIAEGDVGLDYGFSISTNSLNNVYAGGYFEGVVDFDPSGNTSNLTSLGMADAFIQKFGQCVIDNSIMLIDDLTVTANSSGLQYQWVNCDENYSTINGATNQVFTATANGNYAVIITEGSCVDTSNCITIDNVGLENVQLSTVKAYPKPATSEITIEINSSGQNYTLTDQYGRVVSTGILNDKISVVSMEGFEVGTYYMIIEEILRPVKIIKQ